MMETRGRKKKSRVKKAGGVSILGGAWGLQTRAGLPALDF